MAIVPVLCLLFKVDLPYAIGATLVSVIVTSSGAAAVYVRDGYSNIRIGMFLEVATPPGALSGANRTAIVAARWIGLVFGLVLVSSAWASLCGRSAHLHFSQDNWLAIRLNVFTWAPQVWDCSGLCDKSRSGANGDSIAARSRQDGSTPIIWKSCECVVMNGPSVAPGKLRQGWERQSTARLPIFISGGWRLTHSLLTVTRS